MDGHRQAERGLHVPGTRVMTIHVLLADDQPLIRAGFRMLLEEQPDITVIAEAADGGEAIHLTRELRPDVILMDVRMPRTDGIEATRRIVEEFPDARVLVLTTYDLDEYAFTALRYGASGFLLGVRDRVHAVIFAYQAGLVRPEPLGRP